MRRSDRVFWVALLSLLLSWVAACTTAPDAEKRSLTRVFDPETGVVCYVTPSDSALHCLQLVVPAPRVAPAPRTAEL